MKTTCRVVALGCSLAAVCVNLVHGLNAEARSTGFEAKKCVVTDPVWVLDRQVIGPGKYCVPSP